MKNVHHRGSKGNRKQARQSTYNVTLRRVRKPLLWWKRNEYYILWVYVFSLRYPASSAHAPYYYLWPAPLYNIFLNYLINGPILENALLNTKCVLIFFTTFVWNISHSKKNWGRYYRKCVLVFTYSIFYSCPILMKLEFTRQIFEKFSNIKFHENPSSGRRVVPCGRTDRQDESNSRFLQFW